MKTNRLGQEKSPYLLQHQHNPVAWFAWGDEAFATARREHLPIFLSIGYSTCHWCHVMERESFEDEATARFLNEHFVSIKLDREERPDVDKIYMSFLQALTGAGGWPLNAFLTPDLRPFYAGTYWPPAPRQGRPSFLQVLQQIHTAWDTRRPDLESTAADAIEKLAAITARTQSSAMQLDKATLQTAGQQLKHGYDAINGGFGSTPKFPIPSHPRFLLRYAARFDDREAIQMVLHTCDRMAAGGIHDQLGGGFARYSVDGRWHVPHFEKMLYDNAQLAQLYLDAFLISGDPNYATVTRDIIDYVLREMTHPDGGFYSAEDADSEGKEGKFYCWTVSDLEALLTAEEVAATTAYFGITAEGNFFDHSDPGALLGQNVLRIANPLIAQSQADVLANAKAKMRRARALRVRPHLDDKILSSWNGLMVGAIARAGSVLGEERYLVAAEKNLAFIKGALWKVDTQTLYHRWRGERDGTELLESYASLLGGVIDLYEATLKPLHLEFAITLAEQMIARFYDEAGGFWQSPMDAKNMILRLKDDYDGAEPSGNAVAASSLLRLAAITARDEFRAAATQTLKLFADRMRENPHGTTYLLGALDFAIEEPYRVVIAGNVTAANGPALRRAAHQIYQPNRVVLGTEGPVDSFAQGLTLRGDSAMAYVCTGTLCRPPSDDPAIITASLR